MCDYSGLQVSAEAGGLVRTARRRARDLLLRQLAASVVLLCPIFDPVLILHTVMLVAPVRNCNANLLIKALSNLRIGIVVPVIVE